MSFTLTHPVGHEQDGVSLLHPTGCKRKEHFQTACRFDLRIHTFDLHSIFPTAMAPNSLYC
jgi:hypothetical protein